MTEKSQKALTMNQITVNYGDISVLWDITLQIPHGKIVGIIGPNGAGKTTFIKTALGLIKPISGKVEFFGKPISKVRKQIAYIPQRESVDWDFPITVKDLVLMGRYGHIGFLRMPTKTDRAHALKYLEMVGMDQYLNRQISQLSGGQQQRVFLARAFMQDADIYFMDEPFVGIDMASKSVIMKILKDLKKQGKTVLVVNHDLDNLKSFLDWTIILNIRLVACGPTNETFTPENLNRAYGKSSALFDEALKLEKYKKTGFS